MQTRAETMCVTRIEVNGYRRLASTATNINGDITAFIGSNEAGKSSFLQALEWTSNRTPLPADAHHGLDTLADDHVVTKVYYKLSNADRDALWALPLTQTPQQLTLAVKVDGSATYTISPTPTVDPDYRARLRDALHRAQGVLGDELTEDPDDEPSFSAADPALSLERTIETLDTNENGKWHADELASLTAIRNWFDELPEDSPPFDREALIERLDEAHSTFSHPDGIYAQTFELLHPRIPRFISFAEEHRDLGSTYALQPDQRGTHTAALKTVLAVAGLDVDALWDAIATAKVMSRKETLLKQANKRLLELFSNAWNQSGVTLRLVVNGTNLEVQLDELDPNGRTTSIDERSDGLKAFVALVTFLAQHSTKVPPILLVDEAELHLHLDAQADLVSVLFKHVNARQVLYTTHSPGCLPSDLGTAVRIVKKDPNDPARSIIRHDFWQSGSPGFSPLLFAMGASAAAFSICRHAVLAEGAADMVLLPTLIRLATGTDDLTYQIAPGLSNLRGSGFNEDDLAARVLYLADGDNPGKTHAKTLTDGGVPKNRVFTLPTGAAIEDLIKPADYLNAVNSLLSEANAKHVTLEDLDSDLPIASAYEAWAKKHKTLKLSKVDVAYRLLDQKLTLTPTGKRALITLHSKFTAAFKANDNGTPSAQNPQPGRK